MIDAGMDQTVSGGSVVQLSGTTTGDSASWSLSWSQTAGTTVALENPSSSSPTFQAPGVSSNPQVLTFRYAASRDWSWCRREVSGSCVDTVYETSTTSDIVDVTVRASLSVVVESYQTVGSGVSVSLSGLATGGSETKSYTWVQMGGSSTVVLNNANQASAYFTAPTVAARATLSFQLTVTAGSEMSTDVVDVLVLPPPVVAEAGLAQTVESGASVTLSGLTTWGEGLKNYSWVQTGGWPTVALSDADQMSVSFMAPTVVVMTELDFALTVADLSGSSTDTVRVTVSAKPPQVTGLSLASRPISGDRYKQGETIRVQVWLSELAVVSGSPQLALEVGNQTRTMSYTGLDRARVLEFDYTVQASDTDIDGVSVWSGALSLPSGASLMGEAGGVVGVDLSAHAILNASGHKVDGEQSAVSPLPNLNECSKEEVSVLNLPDQGSD